ncbi:hypothetical protein C4F40_20850 [Sphingobacterium sp. Ka21]|uniref:Uncharacterized protein n=1 Tax=Sphingobacterium pedocola TaxID=2082722 RepID=A0ABR9TD38_9SPHI|nr:hypothetical protein [Sphingobacterium pedocola]
MYIYWNYYKTILIVNVSLSVAFGVGYFSMLPYIFATIGFVLSCFLVQFFENNTMYLYYNLGFSRTKLLLGALLFNSLIALFLLAIIWI